MPEDDFLQQQLDFSGQSALETSKAEPSPVSNLPVSKLPEQLSDTSTEAFLTVSELTERLDLLIQDDPLLGGLLTVKGEISNTKRSSRGHTYFTLKDSGAGINGILWAALSKALPFRLEDGQEVYLTGHLEIYAPSGTYSLVAKRIEPVGTGSLQLAFQQTRERLEAEGLFRPEYKRPLPEFPERIGIVTSGTGAVIHDMLRVIHRKNPYVNILVTPVKVQGTGACDEIASAIQELNHPTYALDLLMVARGGGSFEDLFCFSEEPVVRAIFDSKIPVITGIGHEPDFSLADAVADYSASTPTAAAERAVPDFDQIVAGLQLYKQRLLDEIFNRFIWHEQLFDGRATAFVEICKHTLEATEIRLEKLTDCFLHESGSYLQAIEQKLLQSAAELEALSPLSTLARGYALAARSTGTLITSAGQVQEGESICLKLRDGQLQCEVLHHARD